MSQTPESTAPSDGAWPAAERTPPVPNTSLLPGSEQAPAPAAQLLKRVVQGAHDTIDRLADSAAPTVLQLGASVSGAGDALQAKTDQLRTTRDEWSANLRATVRSKPLVSVAAALALGVFIARITR